MVELLKSVDVKQWLFMFDIKDVALIERGIC